MLNSPSLRKIIGLQLITFGLYYYYWSATSRRELNGAIGSKYVPSAWLLILPGLNYWWVWQYAHALESVTMRRFKYSETFLLYIIASGVASSVVGGVLQFILALGSDEEATSEPELFFIAGCVVAVIFLSLLTTNTLFMSIMQKKVDSSRQA